MSLLGKSQRGYSLIELLIVMGVLGVLATIIVASISNAVETSRQKATMADMRTIARAIEAYAVDHRSIPDALGGMTSLREQVANYTNNGAFPTHDKWGHLFRYTGSGESYTIESFGKDGLNGQDYANGTIRDFDLDLVLVNGLFVAAPE